MLAGAEFGLKSSSFGSGEALLHSGIVREEGLGLFEGAEEGFVEGNDNHTRRRLGPPSFESYEVTELSGLDASEYPSE